MDDLHPDSRDLMLVNSTSNLNKRSNHSKIFKYYPRNSIDQGQEVVFACVCMYVFRVLANNFCLHRQSILNFSIVYQSVSDNDVGLLSSWIIVF